MPRVTFWQKHNFKINQLAQLYNSELHKSAKNIDRATKDDESTIYQLKMSRETTDHADVDERKHAKKARKTSNRNKNWLKRGKKYEQADQSANRIS